MRNRYAALLALLFLSLCVGRVGAADESKSIPPLDDSHLIRNGGFETGVQDWALRVPDSPAYTRVSGEEAFAGQWAMRVTVTETSNKHIKDTAYAARTDLPTTPGNYRLDVAIRTDLTQGAAAAIIVADKAEGGHIVLVKPDEKNGLLIEGKTPWKNYAMTYPLPPGQYKKIVLQLEVRKGLGSAWFDHVRVQQLAGKEGEQAMEKPVPVAPRPARPLPGPAGEIEVKAEEVTAKAAFTPRDTAEDLVFDDKMWLSNGYSHGGKLFRDLYTSTDGKLWTQVKAATPYDGYSEMVVYDGKLWAVKGSVWNSTDGKDWTQVLAKTPFGARGYGELLVHDGKMWQLGSGADVWHTTNGSEWTCVTKQTPYGDRAATAVVSFKGKLWVMGGYIKAPNDPPEKGYAKFTTFNDVWCSTDGVEWTRVLDNAPWAPRMWFIAKVYHGRMWLVGGYDNANQRNLGDVWCSDDGVAWYRVVSQPTFSPRHEPTCYVYDDSLWVVAGNKWPVLNDVWRLTLPQK